MKKLKAGFSRYFVLFFLLVTYGFAQETNLRLLSMGSCGLVLSDRDNELNVYDFGKNPAALTGDQTDMWLAARTWGNYTRGSFHRQLDPKSQSQVNLLVEGVKQMGTGGTFRGFISYYNEELHAVYRALEYEPYHDIFTPIDTTTGTFDYYGPVLGMEYSHQVTSWVALGARIHYRLQDGLKREPSKTKVDARMIFGVIGVQLTPNKRLSVGLAYRPFSVQYRLNANKAYLVDYPIIYKYFGDSLLVKNEKVGTYNRTTRGEGFGSDGVVVYRLSSGLTLAAKGGYELESRKIDEGSSAGQRDIDDYGSWQKQGPWAEVVCRMQPVQWPLSFGASVNWRKWGLWARTPRFQTVFEEMEGGSTGYGFGAAYEKFGSPLILGVEYHATAFNEEKRNYYQNHAWERSNSVGLFKCGGEIKAASWLALRAGGAIGEEAAEYHLSFDPVKVLRLSFGAGIISNRLHLDITGFYERLRPESGDGERENFLLMLQVSQWR